VLGVLLHAPRGPFYSPKAARNRWSFIWKAIVAFCPWAHRTVNCVWSPSFSGEADHCCHDPLGTPDSPVAHRTVRCGLVTVGSGHASLANCATDRWHRRGWLTGQSGAHQTVQWIIVVTPPTFSESCEFIACASLGTRHCPVHTEQSGASQVGASLAGLGQTSPILFLMLFDKVPST
jgi:hypothetical protein